MGYEEALTYLGGFGRYQRWITFFLCLVGISHAWQILGIVFLAGSPEHWCYNPELERFNISRENRMRLSVPTELKDGAVRYSRCELYDINFKRYSERNIRELLQELDENNRTSPEAKTKLCNNWKYDPASPYQNTIVTQWDLVCERRWLVPTAASVFMAGLMVGVYAFGEIADRFGRRPALMAAIVIFNVSSILVSFSPNYTAFVILRFITGFCTMAIYTTGFVLRLELVSTKWRVFTGLAGEGCWSVGFMLLAAIAYGVPNWMHLQLTMSVPTLLFLTFFFCIPESPRWLFARRRDTEANSLIEKMAKVNGVEMPKSTDVATQVDDYEDEIKVKKGTLLDLIRTPNMRKKTLSICFNWLVVSLVYYGLSLNTSNLGGNDYLNFLYFGAVEIPALLFTYFTLTYLGRRWTLSGCMVMGGVALLLTIPVPTGMNWLVIALSLLGKFCISAAFAIIYIYSAELFPTDVRNIGVGIGSLNARIGGIIAPYIAQTSDMGRSIPSTIFGVLAILAGLIVILLPETREQKLPDTLEEGELFGKVYRTMDKATSTSDEEVYKIAYSRSEMSLRTSDGYMTDESEWVPNSADLGYGLSNLGYRSNSTTNV